jgi:hypothetical protein
MRRSVGQLSAPGPLDRGRLARHPASGLVVERVLALLADLAFEINRQVAAVVSAAVYGYQEYVSQVTSWTAAHAPEGR